MNNNTYIYTIKYDLKIWEITMMRRIGTYRISQLLDKWGIRHQHCTSVKLRGRIKTLAWNSKSDKNKFFIGRSTCEMTICFAMSSLYNIYGCIYVYWILFYLGDNPRLLWSFSGFFIFFIYATNRQSNLAIEKNRILPASLGWTLSRKIMII